MTELFRDQNILKYVSDTLGPNSPAKTAEKKRVADAAKEASA
jgi:hypothetical protein